MRRLSNILHLKCEEMETNKVLIPKSCKGKKVARIPRNGIFLSYIKLFLVLIAHYSHSCSAHLQLGNAGKDVAGGHDGFVLARQTMVELIQLSLAQCLRIPWLL